MVKTRAFVAGVLLLTAAGCGSDDEESSESPASQPPATAAAPAATSAGGSETTAPDAGPVATTAGGPTTTGVGAGTAATGEPLLIGFTNLEGGAISLPEVRHGAEEGVKYINEQMGGIQGRPIELVRCDVDASPEKSVDCGNKFVEAGVVAVMQGVDVGADAMLPVLRDAGLPMFGFVPFGPQQREATDIAVFFGAAVPAFGAAELQSAADQGQQKLRLFLGDLPSSHSYDESVLQPTAEKLGLDVKVIYYDPANPDWNVLVTTALADDPDSIGSPSAQEAECIGFIQAAKTSGFDGPIFGAACNVFIDALGDQAVGVQTYSDYWLPSVAEAAPPEKQQEIQAYVDAMTAAGYEDEIDGYAGFTFTAAVTFARAMNAQPIDGEIDGSVILKTMTSAKDIDGFMRDRMMCGGTAWPGETSCGTSVLIYEVIEGGDRKLISDGFVDVSEFAPEG